jgi:hypothetical protein
MCDFKDSNSTSQPQSPIQATFTVHLLISGSSKPFPTIKC